MRNRKQEVSFSVPVSHLLFPILLLVSVSVHVHNLSFIVSFMNLLSDMSWEEVGEYLERDDRVILPLALSRSMAGTSD